MNITRECFELLIDYLSANEWKDSVSQRLIDDVYFAIQIDEDANKEYK